MKNFLSFEKFLELKFLFILEFIFGLVLAMLITVNKLHINYWDLRAFVLSITIWLLSSIIDKETYWNLGTLIGIGSFMYLIWFFILNIFTT